MPATRTAIDVLDRNFLEIRHCMLDIAAALDRIDRADGAAKTRAEPRYLQLDQAIRVLTDGKPDRAERIQMVFSLPYEENWPRGFGLGEK
jgi:hypothetical protein